MDLYFCVAFYHAYFYCFRLGVTTVTAFIVQVSFTVPALIEMGIPAINAHKFIFYFAIISVLSAGPSYDLF